ncbi:hypothetical protein, partial [Legionella pneumophila]
GQDPRRPLAQGAGLPGACGRHQLLPRGGPRAGPGRGPPHLPSVPRSGGKAWGAGPGEPRYNG